MNVIFDLVVGIDTEYFVPGTKQTIITNMVNEAISLLIGLQIPLLAMWNVCKTSDSIMVNWADQINREIELLSRMLDEERNENRIFIIDHLFVSKAEFVKTMCELHKRIHGIVVHAPIKYGDTSTANIRRLADEALFHVMKANVKMPTTRVEYENRRGHISKAISYLNKLQRPLSIYFSLLEYGERPIKEISTLLENELKMLCGLNKSDKERFSKLI